ncbi:hypothetical protein MKZ38_009082 [Zalerion maritima]|uniref:F-box domain-containing protein n=1 Tax=Zalerion maritima TaxID=339359 RepID=A0AAD5WNA8_9PEZI|nr:hypothetical protein MKZ38_009082 [Zalerion maritima]
MTHTCCVWTRLVIPQNILEAQNSPLSHGASAQAPSLLGSSSRQNLATLPNEILDMVFGYLERNSYDMISLTLASRRLLAAASNYKLSPAFPHECHGACVNLLRCATSWQVYSRHEKKVMRFRDFLLRMHLPPTLEPVIKDAEKNGPQDVWSTTLCSNCYEWQPMDDLWWLAEVSQFWRFDNTDLRLVQLNPERYVEMWCRAPEEVKFVCPRCSWHFFLDTKFGFNEDTQATWSSMWTMLGHKHRHRIGKGWSRGLPLHLKHWIDFVETEERDSMDENLDKEKQLEPQQPNGSTPEGEEIADPGSAQSELPEISVESREQGGDPAGAIVGGETEDGPTGEASQGII